MSFAFDSTVPQYVEAAAGIDLTSVSNWTMGVWGNSADWTLSGGDQTLIGRHDFVGSDGFQWYMQVRNNAHARAVFVDNFFEVLDDPNPLSNNTWYLMIMRFGAHDAVGSSSLDLWRGDVANGGSVVASTVSSTPAHSVVAPMRIGAGGSGSIEAPVNGKISRPFIILGTTISDAQCTALLAANPTGSSFFTIKEINELVDYAGFTTLTNHGATYSTSEPFSSIQHLRPDADVSAGSWTPSTGVDLFAMIDESVASDTDYVTSGATPVLDKMKLSLSDVLPPDLGTVTLRVRAKHF